MPPRLFALAASLILLAGCTPHTPPQSTSSSISRADGPLKLASWNLEFLAAQNGSGCHPRQDEDYARMRVIADSLDADVIAFEEAESPDAAARVFDPARYRIVMEDRPGKPGGSCGGEARSQTFIRQAVGFAIRKDLPFTRAPDFTDLAIGNPNLRSGVDITVTPTGGTPLRLLAVHLKSGCFQGSTGPACPQLIEQMPILARWIDAAAAGPIRFAVLGDWNRRLALPGDIVWSTIDDKIPANDDLTLTDRGISPKCDPRFHDFIDHIVLDKRAGAQFQHFAEMTFAPGEHPSDHCPITVVLRR